MTSNDVCDICQAVVKEMYALCDDCGEKVGYWDGQEDTYYMKDGSKYEINLNTGRYELRI